MQTRPPPSSQAALIIQRFGGIRPFARVLEMQTHTTVQYWLEKGFIPRAHSEAVIAALIELGEDRQSAEAMVGRAAAGLPAGQAA